MKKLPAADRARILHLLCEVEQRVKDAMRLVDLIGF